MVLSSLSHNEGRTAGKAISDIIDYVKNPEKTDHGRLITSQGPGSGGNRRFIYRGTGTQFSTFHLNFGVERHFTCVLQGGLRQLNSCRLRQRPHNGQFFSTCLDSGGFFSAIPD